MRKIRSQGTCIIKKNQQLIEKIPFIRSCPVSKEINKRPELHFLLMLQFSPPSHTSWSSSPLKINYKEKNIKEIWWEEGWDVWTIFGCERGTLVFLGLRSVARPTSPLLLSFVTFFPSWFGILVAWNLWRQFEFWIWFPNLWRQNLLKLGLFNPSCNFPLGPQDSIEKFKKIWILNFLQNLAWGGPPFGRATLGFSLGIWRVYIGFLDISAIFQLLDNLLTWIDI